VPSPTATKIVIAIAAVLAILLSLVTGKSIDQEGYKWISGIAGAVGILVLAYDRYIWRWPLIRKIAEWKGRGRFRATRSSELSYLTPRSAVLWLLLTGEDGIDFAREPRDAQSRLGDK
jgi:hypothetical protein